MADPLEHLASTLDGYQRASTADEQRLYLRAAVRGCVASADALAKALRILLAAVSRETR